MYLHCDEKKNSVSTGSEVIEYNRAYFALCWQILCWVHQDFPISLKNAFSSSFVIRGNFNLSWGIFGFMVLMYVYGFLECTKISRTTSGSTFRPYNLKKMVVNSSLYTYILTQVSGENPSLSYIESPEINCAITFNDSQASFVGYCVLNPNTA